MSGNVKIRTVSPEDAEKLLEIYAPYVLNTAISFEYEVPDLSEFRRRIEGTLKRYPYLAAEIDGEIAGYAYTGTFVGRTAYERAAEMSIYLREDRRKKIIGEHGEGAELIGFPELEAPAAWNDMD